MATKTGLAQGGTNADLSATGGAGKYLKQATAGAAITVGSIPESDLVFTDIATNNASTSNHGFLKKLDGTATHYMDGSGNWSTPAGGGGSSDLATTLGIGNTSGSNNIVFASTFGLVLSGANSTRDFLATNIATVDSLANIFMRPNVSSGNKAISLDLNPRGTGLSLHGDGTLAQIAIYNKDYEADTANTEAMMFRTTGINGGMWSWRNAGTGSLRDLYIVSNGSELKTQANVIFKTDQTTLFQSDVGIGATATTYSNYNTLSLGSATSGGRIDFQRSGTLKYELGNDGSDVFHLYSALTTADVITISNANAAVKVIGANGGYGYMGGYSSSFFGFWGTVSPTNSNYSLIASSVTLALNVGTGGTGKFFINDSTQLGGWTSAGFFLGGSLTPSAKLHIAAGSSTAGTAPLKLTAGTNLTVTEGGTMEYDGANFYLTPVSSANRGTIPLAMANNNIAAQTSAGNITTLTSASSNSTYNVGGYVNVIAISVDVIQMQITYTDENNTSQTISFSTLSAIGNSTYSPVTIAVKASTLITVKTNLTVSGGSITFDAGGYIQKAF